MATFGLSKVKELYWKLLWMEALKGWWNVITWTMTRGRSAEGVVCTSTVGSGVNTARCWIYDTSPRTTSSRMHTSLSTYQLIMSPLNTAHAGPLDVIVSTLLRVDTSSIVAATWVFVRPANPREIRYLVINLKQDIIRYFAYLGLRHRSLCLAFRQSICVLVNALYYYILIIFFIVS